MTTGSTELGDILTGTAPEAPEAEVAAPTAETVVETTTQAAPAAAETPKDDKPPPGHVPVHALTEERRKRQELESRLAQLEAAKPPEAKPNLFEDPDNWEKSLDERVERKLAEVRQQSEQRFLVLVEQAAKARHTDFEEVAKVFAETARVTPGLIEEARQAPDPAEFIYRAGQNLRKVQEAGSIEALIAQAEARGEERARQALNGKPQPKIPESLTDIAGATGERAPTAPVAKPLSELLPTY